MLSSNRNIALQKNLILTAIGVGLQTAGAVCLLTAAIGIGKEVNRQIKATIAKELMKQVGTE